MHVTGVLNALVLWKASEPFIDQLNAAKSQLEMTDSYKLITGWGADQVSVALILSAFKDASKVSRRLRRRQNHTQLPSPHAANIQRDITVNLHHISACKQSVSGEWRSLKSQVNIFVGKKKCNFVPVFFIYVMSPLSWRGVIINTNGLTNKEALGCKLHSRIFPGNQFQPSRC